MKKEYLKPEVDFISLIALDEITSLSGGTLEGSQGLEDVPPGFWN